MTKKSERRQHLRTNTTMYVIEKNELKNNIFRANNISERGMQVTFPIMYDNRTSDSITLQFYIPGEMIPIKIKGTILCSTKRDKDSTTSIVFNPMAFFTTRRIRHYVVQEKRKELFDRMLKLHLAV